MLQCKANAQCCWKQKKLCLSIRWHVPQSSHSYYSLAFHKNLPRHFLHSITRSYRLRQGQKLKELIATLFFAVFSLFWIFKKDNENSCLLQSLIHIKGINRTLLSIILDLMPVQCIQGWSLGWSLGFLWYLQVTIHLCPKTPKRPSSYGSAAA